MNEPKKSVIEAAAKRKWPKLAGSKINHRKHTMELFFRNGRSLVGFLLEAKSHRDMLAVIDRTSFAPFTYTGETAQAASEG